MVNLSLEELLEKQVSDDEIKRIFYFKDIKSALNLKARIHQEDEPLTYYALFNHILFENTLGVPIRAGYLKKILGENDFEKYLFVVAFADQVKKVKNNRSVSKDDLLSAINGVSKHNYRGMDRPYLREYINGLPPSVDAVEVMYNISLL